MTTNGLMDERPWRYSGHYSDDRRRGSCLREPARRAWSRAIPTPEGDLRRDLSVPSTSSTEVRLGSRLRRVENPPNTGLRLSTRVILNLGPVINGITD